MSIAPVNSATASFPEAKDAAEARVKAINAAGGIAGHQVQLDFCDSKVDPNAESACARKASANHDVAIVGGLLIFPGTYAVLEKEKIPMLGGWAILPQDFTSPDVWQYTSGVPGWFGGAVTALKKSGAKSIAVIQCDSPACAYAGATAKSFADLGGLKVVSAVTVPSLTADPSALVAKALATHPDGVVLAEITADTPKVMAAIHSAGYTGKIATNTGAVTPAAIKAMGAAGNGLMLTSQVKPVGTQNDPGIEQFRTEMQAQNPQAQLDDNGEAVWGSFVVFQKLLAGTTGAVTSDTVRTALSKLSTPIDPEIAAPFSTVGKTSPVSAAPRLFSPSIYVQTIENGKLVVQSSQALDVVQALRG